MKWPIKNKKDKIKKKNRCNNKELIKIKNKKKKFPNKNKTDILINKIISTKIK